MREHFKVHDNVLEQTKNATFEKSSEQIVQIQKPRYEVLKLQFQENRCKMSIKWTLQSKSLEYNIIYDCYDKKKT